MSKSLPAIIKETTEIVLALIEGEGLLPAELEIAQETNELELSAKANSYGYALDEISSRKEFMKAKIKEYGAVLARLEKAEESVESRMMWALDTLGVREIAGSEVRFSLVQNPPRLVVENESAIPNVFFKIPDVKPELDKGALKEALQGGADIPGCRVERGVRLSRKINTSSKKAVSK